MHGFINIDKPASLTSFDVIRILRQKIKCRMGHLGTLDPIATGVLPIAVGNATRLIPFLEDEVKEYRARARFGAWSDTQDATGRITASTNQTEISHELLLRELKRFIGTIWQKPPMYSAVHHQGKRLYELAREGQQVDIKPRLVTIHKLELTDFNRDEQGWWADLDILCSKGTYIRTLIHDLGEKLGCGAYMERLTRTKVGPFSLSDAVKPLEFDESKLLPLDFPFSRWPELLLEGKCLKIIKNGGRIELTNNLEGSQVLVKDRDGHFIALAEIRQEENKNILHPLRVLNHG